MYEKHLLCLLTDDNLSKWKINGGSLNSSSSASLLLMAFFFFFTSITLLALNRAGGWGGEDKQVSWLLELVQHTVIQLIDGWHVLFIKCIQESCGSQHTLWTCWDKAHATCFTTQLGHREKSHFVNDYHEVAWTKCVVLHTTQTTHTATNRKNKYHSAWLLNIHKTKTSFPSNLPYLKYFISLKKC